MWQNHCISINISTAGFILWNTKSKKTTKMPYLFKSKRLGFRNWVPTDVEKMHKICSNPDVMRFFPLVLTLAQTRDLIQRMQEQYVNRGYCYFAVDKLSDNSFIGFIGLAYQEYEAHFTPCVDIGWRLAKEHWNNGYATEGALRCLKYGFDDLKLSNIKSICSTINKPSENVMIKLGMQKIDVFNHPKLKGDRRLESCFLYEIDAAAFIS
jgi:RimJ/RimL family protein N-acetyltransferase